jgi:hypothetical protein
MNSEASTEKPVGFYELQQRVQSEPRLRLPMPAQAQKPPTPPALPKLPATPTEPTLSVYQTTDKEGYVSCTCTLSKALLLLLPNVRANTPVSCGTRVLLVVPSKRGGKWYLDTRPKPGAGVYFTLNKSGGAAARVQPISRTHFMSTVPRFVGAAGKRRITSSANTLARGIKLTLGPELVDNPGYYRLLPLEVKPQAHQDSEEHPQTW